MYLPLFQQMFQALLIRFHLEPSTQKVVLLLQKGKHYGHKFLLVDGFVSSSRSQDFTIVCNGMSILHQNSPQTILGRISLHHKHSLKIRIASTGTLVITNFKYWKARSASSFQAKESFLSWLVNILVNVHNPSQTSGSIPSTQGNLVILLSSLEMAMKWSRKFSAHLPKHQLLTWHALNMPLYQPRNYTCPH